MTRIIFLDRDGVINKYPGNYLYVDSTDKFEFIPGAREAIAMLTNAGFSIFVISNQAGVTKGIYSQETLDKITTTMLSGITKYGGQIEKVLYCIHTDQQNCDCRKPKNGLLKMAIKNKTDINLSESFFIGDSIRDMKAGKSMGCKTILVLTGKQKIENKQSWDLFPDRIEESLESAARYITKKF